MILAIDIGNTNIVLGCADDDKILFRERLGRLLGAEHVRDALGLEVGERDGSQVL